MSYVVGCDPELFLSKDGKIIGSERVIPAVKSLVVRDGIQVELNPHPGITTSILGSWISQAFIQLDGLVKAHPGVKVDWTGVVDVDRAELDALSPEARALGCGPSKNIYRNHQLMTDAVRAAYTIRSAGGHLHFGLKDDLFDERVRLVSWLDVIVGNTCVIIDRDPKASVRREWYGRAGEYRIPPHGLEYRTLSNFWLRNYVLMDLVFSLASLAIKVVLDTIDGGDLESRLIDVVNIDNVVKAIDTNDLDLAWHNFKDISKLGLFNHWPLLTVMNWFEQVEKKGLETVFTQDPVEHWIRGKQMSFNYYIRTVKESKNYGARIAS